jgi:hypothetical protein
MLWWGVNGDDVAEVKVAKTFSIDEHCSSLERCWQVNVFSGGFFAGSIQAVSAPGV